MLLLSVFLLIAIIHFSEHATLGVKYFYKEILFRQILILGRFTFHYIKVKIKLKLIKYFLSGLLKKLKHFSKNCYFFKYSDNNLY